MREEEKLPKDQSEILEQHWDKEMDEEARGKKERMKKVLTGVLCIVAIVAVISVCLMPTPEPTPSPAPTHAPIPEEVMTSSVPTPTPTPEVLPTSTPTPLPEVLTTPSPTPRRGGGHHYRRSQPSLNLVVCDQSGENCQEGSAVPVLFELGNVVPGDIGSTVLTLKNIGNIDGRASMNITNVVSGSGTTPEPEPLPDNGELDENLYINIITANGLTTGGYIIDMVNQSIDLGTLKPGKVLLVEIEWKIPEQVGNEIQGDELSFDTEFRLVGG